MSADIVAIDPGPQYSALVAWDGAKVEFAKYGLNEDVLSLLRIMGDSGAPCVIEQIASYGMAVGAEVFETCVWTGRFMEAFGANRVHRITRAHVKMHLCHSMRAKDGNIRQALIDRFGYGISGDLWAALAVAVTWWDQNRTSPAPPSEEQVEINQVGVSR